MRIEIHGLNKRYGNKHALKNINLSLESGTTGIIGSNGAGKTTLMKIISTICRPTTGQVFFNSVDIAKKPRYLRKSMGFLPQDFGYYPNLNAIEFLSYLGAMKGLEGKLLFKKIEYLLELLNLSDVSRSPLSALSGGMIQRIGIAQSLLNDPAVLIFDEPTVGLDPSERIRFREIVSHLSKEKIIILSSHIISDVESIADNIVLMSKGTLSFHGSQDIILQSIEGRVFESILQEDQLGDLNRCYTTVSTTKISSGYKIRFISDETIDGAVSVMPCLEDLYVYSSLRQH